MVWDTIHGRDPAQAAIEEWGGIAYALAGFDAALDDEWRLVPLIKVGRDLAPRAAAFLRDVRHAVPGARFLEVPELNNRVTLRYLSAERRCEQLTGGVPGWTWPELGPLVSDLDALYVNFISGWEMSLETAELLRRGFRRPIYADFHSLFLGRTDDGTRVLQPLPGADSWFACFDTVQLNEDEFAQLGADPMAAAAASLAAGCSTLIVTLGVRGAVYFRQEGTALAPGGTRPIRTARLAADATASAGADPTGCGDVFGSVTCSALLRGMALEEAIQTGGRMAARNLAHRGATGLRDHLLGRLATA